MPLIKTKEAGVKFDRGSGVLLHPSSLPGPYGIGDLGSEAYRFIDFLKGAGQRLWQVVTNLTLNALTHAFDNREKGVIRIDVGGTRGGRVTIAFSDNGRGIPPAHLERIFEPFFTTRRGRGGAGLGLHIVYNLVTQRLGGGIRCESPPPEGVGTRFLIDLPTTAP